MYREFLWQMCLAAVIRIKQSVTVPAASNFAMVRRNFIAPSMAGRAPPEN